MTGHWEEADQKATLLSKQVSGLEAQLSDAQEMLAEETRLKLSVQSRLRQFEEKVESLQDQLEEEEEAKKSLEQKLSSQTQQVGPADLLLRLTLVTTYKSPLYHQASYIL